ncbi:hypothetical protein AB2B38_005335 [Balneola sp. MJW-20]|uniref:hypothetical protein n=1 Tax=Gracilimonas aurantiaca TaxID=3234185 RepID=UPI0034672B01
MSNSMMELNFEWIPLQPYNNAELDQAQQELHHALQFIALSGKYLLTTKADDSNTNAGWDEKSNSFIGRLIGDKLHVALYAAAFQLQVLNKEHEVLYRLSLDKKTVFECFLWLKEIFRQEGISTRNLELGLHYELPEAFSKDRRFRMPSFELLKELSFHRTNTDRMLKSVKKQTDNASEIRTWPHHFDHALLIPIEIGAKGEILRSCGLGYAINDDLISEPYLYVNRWSKNSGLKFTDKPKLKHGSWYPEKLKGAALPFSKIINAEKQDQVVGEFISNVLNFSLNN